MNVCNTLVAKMISTTQELFFGPMRDVEKIWQLIKKTLSLFERETSGEIVVIIETKAGRYDQCRNEFLYINNF